MYLIRTTFTSACDSASQNAALFVVQLTGIKTIIPKANKIFTFLLWGTIFSRETNEKQDLESYWKWKLCQDSFVCLRMKCNKSIFSHFVFVHTPQHGHAFYIQLAADLKLTQLCETRKKSASTRKQPSQYYHWMYVFETSNASLNHKFGHYCEHLTKTGAKNYRTF